MVEDAASARRVKTVRRASLDPGIVRSGQPGQLGQVPGQAQVAVGGARVGGPTRPLSARTVIRIVTRVVTRIVTRSSSRVVSRIVGQGERPVGQGAGATGQLGQFEGERPFGCRLEGGRVAVPPAPVPAPDRPDDELGLVVDGLQVGALHQAGRAGTPCAAPRPAGLPRFMRARVCSTRDSSSSAVSPSAWRTRSSPDHRVAVARAAGPRALPPASRRGRASGGARRPTRAGTAAPSGGCRHWATPR